MAKAQPDRNCRAECRELRALVAALIQAVDDLTREVQWANRNCWQTVRPIERRTPREPACVRHGDED